MEHNDLTHITMPLIRYDRFGRSVWHNDLAQRMLIAPMETMLGIPPSSIEPFSLRVARYFRALHDVLKTGSPSQIELHFDPQPKEAQKAFLIRFFPELSETGAIVGVLAAAEELEESCP